MSRCGERVWWVRRGAATTTQRPNESPPPPPTYTTALAQSHMTLMSHLYTLKVNRLKCFVSIATAGHLYIQASGRGQDTVTGKKRVIFFSNTQTLPLGLSTRVRAHNTYTRARRPLAPSLCPVIKRWFMDHAGSKTPVTASLPGRDAAEGGRGPAPTRHPQLLQP